MPVIFIQGHLFRLDKIGQAGCLGINNILLAQHLSIRHYYGQVDDGFRFPGVSRVGIKKIRYMNTYIRKIINFPLPKRVNQVSKFIHKKVLEAKI
jgi:hypothetical protein